LRQPRIEPSAACVTDTSRTGIGDVRPEPTCSRAACERDRMAATPDRRPAMDICLAGLPSHSTRIPRPEWQLGVVAQRTGLGRRHEARPLYAPACQLRQPHRVQLDALWMSSCRRDGVVMLAGDDEAVDLAGRVALERRPACRRLARWAVDLRELSPGVARDRLKTVGVGSPFGSPTSGAKHIKMAEHLELRTEVSNNLLEHDKADCADDRCRHDPSVAAYAMQSIGRRRAKQGANADSR
jgi:hypothetical protein